MEKVLQTALLVPEKAQDFLHMKEVLKEEGWEILAFGSGQEALESLSSKRETPHGMALVGLRLSDMNGANLAWRIRRSHATLPIMLVSAHVGKWQLQDLYECGVNKVLEIPISREAFRKQLDRFLGRGFRQRLVMDSAYYRAAIYEAIAERNVYARIINSDRIIVYENEHLERDWGLHMGESCYSFWGEQTYCERCIAKEVLGGKSWAEKVLSSTKGRFRAWVKALKLPDGRPGVVEVLERIS